MAELERAAPAHVPDGVDFAVRADDASSVASTPVLEQRADTVIDARLLAQLVRLASTTATDIVCLDAAGPGLRVDAKSPYAAGVAEPDEAKPIDAEAAGRMVPVGLAVRQEVPGPAMALDVGRYYWHRIGTPADVRAATRQILLSTMKATDGIFARTNRRVSLKISRLLLDTPVTPNMVTMTTLVWGLAAGWLLSLGHHATFVYGSLFAWFASMLDGVDGELARAKFQSSAFGHWLEMVCDYAFYIALFVGLGAGVRRIKGDGIWLLVGIAASIGVVVSFTMVARLKRAYPRRGSMGDFYLAYQRTAGAAGSNPFLRLTPHLMALMTRAGFPYLLVVIALLDMPRGLLIAICIATHAFWMVALYAMRLHLTLQPATAGGSAPVVSAPRVGVAQNRIGTADFRRTGIEPQIFADSRRPAIHLTQAARVCDVSRTLCRARAGLRPPEKHPAPGAGAGAPLNRAPSAPLSARQSGWPVYAPA